MADAEKRPMTAKSVSPLEAAQLAARCKADPAFAYAYQAGYNAGFRDGYRK